MSYVCIYVKDMIYIIYVYIMDYYWAIKPNEISSFVTTCMDPEGIMLSEMSEKRERQLLYDSTNMQNLKKQNK